MSKHGSPTPTRPQGGVDRHGARELGEKQHEPERAPGKDREAAVCEDCRASYHHGHWRWTPAEPGAHTVVCPACRRIREKLPAGTLTLEGPFFLAHRDEILHLARNEADHERQEHPLNRIMGIEDGPTGSVVTTTDIHLPQRIGRALERAYDGELDVRYGEDEYVVRVRWHRG